METTETRMQSTSFIRINGAEHNLDALLKLLGKHNIQIKSLLSRHPDPDTMKRITEDFIPALFTELKVNACSDETRKVLESSNDFRQYVDKILLMI